MSEHKYPRYAMNRGIRYRVESPLSRPMMFDSRGAPSLSWATEAALAADPDTTWDDDPAAELVAKAREAVGDMRQAAGLLRANYNYFVAARIEENADSLAAELDAYAKGGAK